MAGDGYFALDACGTTAVVPVKGFGVADGRRGYYLCPVMGASGWACGIACP